MTDAFLALAAAIALTLIAVGILWSRLDRTVAVVRVLAEMLEPIDEDEDEEPEAPMETARTAPAPEPPQATLRLMCKNESDTHDIVTVPMKWRRPAFVHRGSVYVHVRMLPNGEWLYRWDRSA